MIVVVDTNIVFSGILNPEGTISDLLLNSSNNFNFFAPTAIIQELEKHHKKLLRISRYSENDLNFLKRILLKKIEIIDLESIAPSTWEKAIELVKDVDEFDAPFIALSLELDSPLWTGDKNLTKGKNMEKLANLHPGEILNLEFLEPLEITAYRLSKDLKIPQIRISEIVKGNRRITADTALPLGKYFGNSTKFWLGIQDDYDIEVEKTKKEKALKCF